MLQVSGLFIHPVKSCRAVAVASATLDELGFVGDRRFLLVGPDGRFVTQRQDPRLALVDAVLVADGLQLAAAGLGTVWIPLTASHGGRRVTVWRDEVDAEDCGDEPASWLERLLGRPVRLVRIGATYHRPVRPSKAQPGDVVSFADGYPILLASEASLAQLNDRIQESDGEPVPMNRFRPNIVVGGGGAFAEDGWTRVRIGGVTFRNAGPCTRCIVTTTDQQTGERGKEPLRTLARFRRNREDPGDVDFAINLIHETKRGTIRIGDAVEIL